MMKTFKKLGILAFSLALFSACSGSDDNNGDIDNNPVAVETKWSPTQIELVPIIPIPGIEAMPYEHAPGCNKDFLKIMSNNVGSFYQYAPNTCAEQITEDAYSESGNTATITLNGFTVSGTVTKTTNKMTISGAFNDFLPLIQSVYPDIAQYSALLQGSTVKISFDKL